MTAVLKMKQEETLDSIIAQAALLDYEIKMKQKELKKLKEKIYEEAFFEDGKKTSYLVGGDYQVKIQKRFNTKVDPKKIQLIQKNFPDLFPKFFKTEYKLKSKNILEAADDNFRKAVLWAIEEKEGSPSIQFLPINEDTPLEVR